MTSLAQNLFEFAKIMQSIEDNNGVISDEMLPVISRTELLLEKKVDSYVNFVDVVKGQAEQIKVTIENFKKNLQTLENLHALLKNNVKHLMETHDLIKISGSERSIKLMNSGGVQSTKKPDDMFYELECVNPKYKEELSEYVSEELVIRIKDKEKFKQAVKEEKFESISLMPRGQYVKFI